MKKLYFTIIFALYFNVAYAGTLVENALINDTNYQLAGTFGMYDFGKDAKQDPFDWAFTASNGISYQLQGTEATPSDVFGWKAVSNITTPPPSWYMFQLHGDIDGDGTNRFNWILLSTDLNNKAAYKLSGVSTTGTFTYSDKLNIDYNIEGTTITTGAPGAFSHTVALKKNRPWKFHVTYSSSLGNGSMGIDNISVNCVDPLAGLCLFVGNDYSYYNNQTSIHYTNLFYDDSDAPLVIDEGHLYWNAILSTAQVGSYDSATATHCSGLIPTAQLHNLKNGIKLQWSSPSNKGTAQCVYTLEPL